MNDYYINKFPTQNDVATQSSPTNLDQNATHYRYLP